MSIETALIGVPVKISSSGKDVISSGTVHVFDKKNLEFDISGLKLVFDFIDDNSETRVEWEVDNKTLKAKAYNFNNSLGAGTPEPLPIGNLDERKLYLAFIVSALSGSSLKTVDYTFYLGDSIND